jgi:ribosomal protein L22
MVDEKKEIKPEVKVEENKMKEKTKDAKIEETNESKKVEAPKETVMKKEQSKKETVMKKESAIANASSLQISPKQTKYICRMIRRKDLDTAISLLEGVVAGKVPVKMTGLEVAHQKGKGIAGARFPKTAASAIIDVVKQLKANAVVNGIEDPVISLAISNQASAPFRRGGRKAKRTSLHLEAREKSKFMIKKK